MPNLTKEQVLNGLKQAYRTLPSITELARSSEEVKVWNSRAKALLKYTDKQIDAKIEYVEGNFDVRHPTIIKRTGIAYSNIKQILIDAITELEFEVGVQAIAVDPGNVFDYFNETRKILESAKSEIFLIDPYVDADIVSDYFATIDPSIKIRILTSARPGVLSSIVPAATKLNQQTGINIEIRSVNSSDRLHDRFWLIDDSKGFQSSCSVNAGGKKSAAVIMEVHDIFDATQTTYEGFWTNGDIQLNV